MGWWKLDDGSGTTAVDSSIYQNNGTLVNGPVWSTDCLSGHCLDLDGVDDYVSFGKGPYNSFGTSDFTVAAWVRTRTPGSQTCIASITGGAKGWRFGYGLGRVYYLIGGVGFVEGYFGPAVLLDWKWHHLAVVYSRTDNLVYGYVDGQLVGSRDITTVSGSASYGAALTIGVMVTGFGKVNGWIRDVRIYARGLTATDIQQLYRPIRLNRGVLRNAVFR